MKGMRKISRGSSFSGVMAYAFDGDLDNPRELEGEVVGGNMIGRDPKALANEFNDTLAIRPDVKKAVWHNSLRLPEGEKVSKETWSEIGDAYMRKMGFSDAHPRVYVLHDDPEGQHIHIVASRIGLDGKLFLGKNENLISTKKISELEKEFGLEETTEAKYVKIPGTDKEKVVMPEKSRATKNEMEKALRTETEPPRYQLQKLVDKALMDKPTATQFVERLQAAGVDVIPNIASTGKLSGFSFGLNGVYFSGSKLGDSYKYAQLEKRGLTYDKDRESSFLTELKSRAGNNAERARSASSDAGVKPTASGNDATASRDADDLRRVDSGADRTSDRTARENDSAGPRRSERIERVTAESEPPGSREEAENSIGQGDKPTQGQAGAERPNAPGSSLAPASDNSASAVAAGVGSGVEISDSGFISTGDKATDELLMASHKGRLNAEREVLARQKKQHAEDMAAAKKRQADMNKPNTSRLNSLADRAVDEAWRTVEIQRFAQSLGAGKFQVVCTPANAKAEPIKKVLTAADLQNPKVIKSLSHLAARNHQINIQPHDSAGVILLKGLDADGIKKLEAAGLQPAAVVSFAGKHQAWIATGATMSADERKALTQRIESLVGLQKSSGVSGRLVGFAGAGLVAGSGRVAPGAAELLGEIKSAIFEAKAARRLELAIEKTVKVAAHDYDDIGGIKSLRKGWFDDSCHAVNAEATFFDGKYDPVVIERGVLESMARQGVNPRQAYRAVFDESRVERTEQHAARAVAEAYTRVGLVKEGRDPAGINIKAESEKRYPKLLKHAEIGMESQAAAIRAQVKRDGEEEQIRLDRAAEQRAIDAANAAAEHAAQEREEALKLG